MKRVPVVVAATFVLSAAAVVIGQGQSASATLDAIAAAMSAPNATSLFFSGRGSMYNFGQAVSASAPWPQQVLKTYSADVLLGPPAMRMQASISCCLWSCYGMLMRPCSRNFGNGWHEPARQSRQFRFQQRSFSLYFHQLRSSQMV